MPLDATATAAVDAIDDGVKLTDSFTRVFEVNQNKGVVVSVDLSGTDQNGISYQFQEWDGQNWVNLPALAGSLAVGITHTLTVAPDFPQIRCQQFDGKVWVDIKILSDIIEETKVAQTLDVVATGNKIRLLAKSTVADDAISFVVK